MSTRFEYGKPARRTSSTAPVGPRRAAAKPAGAPVSPHLLPGSDLTRIPAFSTLEQWLPGAPESVAAAPVNFPSALPQAHQARALTDVDGIHLGPQAASLPDTELRSLLAHEAGHVAQQGSSGPIAAAPELEDEAHALAPEILAGFDVRAGAAAPANAVLTDTPPDRAAVEAAKKRLVILNKFVGEWQGREARRLEGKQDRDPLLTKRTKMDEAIPGPPGQREQMETQNIANLNRAPLDIRITDDEVRFHVRFQVRFEDPAMAGRFAELKSNLESGIQLVWNTSLKGVLFGGRQFVIEPEIKQVSEKAARDTNAWLITVRPTDTGPVNYPGCSLPQPPAGVPTSVTDSTCDGGVMSIPPRHISSAFTFGHEVLHLFGLVDRYMMLTHTAPGKKPITETAPARETGKRPDPLGDQPGKILDEDLAFLFDRLGVYTQEESRGLDTLRQMEKQGMTINGVLAEIHRQQEIINRGGSRPTLIKPRTDFIDKMEKDAERL